jgi:hypothetical protein
MTTMVSASAIASSCECVTCTKVRPSSFCQRRSSARIWMRRKGSSADSGSSSSSTRGSVMSARASATRCCWPPDSSPGLRAARWPMATRSSRSLARLWRSALPMPFILRLKATLSVAERCGKSAKLWNIMAVPRAAAGRLVMLRLSSRMSPLVTDSWPAIMRSVVLLPQPEGPSRQQ